MIKDCSSLSGLLFYAFMCEHCRKACNICQDIFLRQWLHCKSWHTTNYPCAMLERRSNPTSIRFVLARANHIWVQGPARRGTSLYERGDPRSSMRRTTQEVALVANKAITSEGTSESEGNIVGKAFSVVATRLRTQPSARPWTSSTRPRPCPPTIAPLVCPWEG
jgi:hypothetical protein